MELYAATTRFALACNTSSKIIEPIQSRCAILRYSRLDSEELLQVLVRVAKAEGVGYSPDGMEALLFVAEGDMRQALNGLQATHAAGQFVTGEAVYRVCDQPHPGILQSVLLKAVAEHDLDGALAVLEPLLAKGYSPIDLVGSLFRVAKGLPSGTIADPVQLAAMREIGNCHVRILDGCPTALQLYGLVAKLVNVK